MVPVVEVTRDLTAVQQMAAQLQAEAIDHSASHLLPGGRATVALAPVANQEAWAWQISGTQQWNTAHPELPPRDLTHVQDEYDTWTPPLQLLRFWSEDWRRVHNADYERQWTIQTEAGFLRWCLTWAYENEPRWTDFAADIRSVRVQLEALLHAGERDERGVPCLTCDRDLVRANRDPQPPRRCEGQGGACTWPHRYCPLHDRGGLVDEWVCPSCHRHYDEETYRRAVAHAHFLHAEFLPLRDCMERTGAKRGSIQTWAARGQVAKRQDPNTGRMTYRVADVQSRMG